jgi:nicotinamide-nucleotide amidase
MSDKPSIDSLAREIGQWLQARGLKLVTAESCTGGWLAKIVTDIAGSSSWFERGFVTYSNDSKMELLGVSAELLNAHGAVSEQTAREMAQGALHHSRADIAVAVTGIAGPDGGSINKPIGTVWVAWHQWGADASAMHYVFEGDRARVRYQAVVAALEGILRIVG